MLLLTIILRLAHLIGKQFLEGFNDKDQSGMSNALIPIHLRNADVDALHGSRQLQVRSVSEPRHETPRAALRHPERGNRFHIYGRGLQRILWGGAWGKDISSFTAICSCASFRFHQKNADRVYILYIQSQVLLQPPAQSSPRSFPMRITSRPRVTPSPRSISFILSKT